MNDTVKASFFLVGFVLLIPSMYLAPTILNALTDILMRIGG